MLSECSIARPTFLSRVSQMRRCLPVITDIRYRYEQAFVHNLLVHLKCGEIDPQYTPTHGHGAVPSAPPPRTSRSRNRRAHP
jgi:hypothetical protein